MKNFKNVIIGFGKAGRALAKFLSQHGEESVIIERDKAMYGGTCPNVGCAPSKTLIYAGHAKQSFAAAMAKKRQVCEVLHNGAYHGAADEPLVSVLDGVASFSSPTELTVTAEDGTITSVTGERFFINTGSTPIIPDIVKKSQKKSQNILTSTTAMELDELPQNLVIIGAGYIGLEFAGMFNSFGAKVTVLESSPVFLPNEDADISAAIFADLTNSGINLQLSANVEKISDTEVVASGKSYKADKILLAAGRKPNIEDLQLQNAGVQLENGYIKVTDTLQTTAPNIWAMGDVRGGPQFYYLSTDDFRIISNQLFGDKTRKLSDRTPVPYSIFITPPLSHVGLSEKSAQAQGVKYRLFKMPAAPIVRTKVAQDMRGMLKALVDPQTSEILGVTLYHVDSHEVINLITLAMQAKMPYTALRDRIYTHPTATEGLNDLFSNEVKVSLN
ncbi:MAG: FAD-dependent oxidoreductase [Defluviitaleaceae bacterium]|nr:FAD-dependent oxidoreductase [Defluviitaleaceae bacterium]